MYSVLLYINWTICAVETEEKMPPKHYQLSWDSYKSNINNGFSQLQQSEEFVDMTLAAEGHLVKVHRNLIALASPYLKEMLKTAPCQHPVIFLHNIRHEVLSLILEYIYMGEVRIPKDLLHPFIKACKALHINGASDIDPKHFPKQRENEEGEGTSAPEAHPQIQATSVAEISHPTFNKPNFAAHITINSENYNVEVQSLENDPSQDKRSVSNNDQLNLNQGHVLPHNVRQLQIISEDVHRETPLDVPMIDTSSDLIDEVATINNKQSSECLIEPVQTAFLPSHINIGQHDVPLELTPQYSVSNRGCLQLILNRYVYYRHHVSMRGRKQRWRCINYRRMHCPAQIDSDGEILTSRKGVHCHLFHDNIILKKIKKGFVFSSITSANQQAENLNEMKMNKSDDDNEDDTIIT